MEAKALVTLSEHALGEETFASDVYRIVRAGDRTFYLSDRGLDDHIVSMEVSDDLTEVSFGTVGSGGEGPGEFRNAGAIGITADGSLWVFDSTLGRVSVFGASSVDVGTLPVRFSQRGDSFRAIGLLSDGSFILEESLGVLTLDRSADRTATLMRSSGDGSDLQTITTLDLTGRLLRVPVREGAVVQSVQPWSEADLRAVSDAGEKLIVVRQRHARRGGSVVSVEAYGTGGRLMAATEHEFAESVLVELSGDEVEAWIAEYLDGGVGTVFQSRAAARNAVRESLSIPDFMPPVRGLLVAHDGKVWLEVAGRSGERRRWLVLGPDLEVVAVVTVPSEVVLMSVADDFSVGFRKGPFGDLVLVLLG